MLVFFLFLSSANYFNWDPEEFSNVFLKETEKCWFNVVFILLCACQSYIVHTYVYLELSSQSAKWVVGWESF